MKLVELVKTCASYPAPAAGSREAATDPPTGLTNPTPDASSSPVPVPVVNEVAEEFWKAWSDPDRDFNMADVEDITKTFLSLPTVKAALAALTVADAHRKIIALQAVERDEAQAKLEAAKGLLRDAICADFIPLDVRGEIARFVEEGGELS